MDEPNPYAAPSAESQVEGAALAVRAGMTHATLVFVALQVLRVLMFAATYTYAPIVRAIGHEETVFTIWRACWQAIKVVDFVDLIVAFVWIHRAWSALPPRVRKVRDTAITPHSAWFHLLIPVYNIYWMFVMNLALGSAYETIARRRAPQHDAAAGAGLVWSAGVLQVLGVAGGIAQGTPLSVFQLAGIAAPLFWIFFMRHVDRLLAAIRR